MSRRAPRIAAILLAAAFLGGAAPPVTVSAGMDAQRIDAGDAAHAAEPAWKRALRIRSEALNRLHGLESALLIRSEALNRVYGLDRGAP